MTQGRGAGPREAGECGVRARAPGGTGTVMFDDDAPQDDAPRRDEELVVEPDNSTVDDWFGQDVQRETEDAERALREAGGDADRAEDIFDERRRPHHRDEFDVPAEERPA